MVQIKICGLTNMEDVAYINQYKPDYAGMVMYFPKSPRNVDDKKAQKLLRNISPDIAKVAVTVSPTVSQLHLIENMGFDYIQIHKDVDSDVISQSRLPVIRAVNVSDNSNIDDTIKYLENMTECDTIYGVLFDAGVPGSGKTFDWDCVAAIRHELEIRNIKLFLAGGLDEDNVSSAVKQVKPDVVDVSSGVEYEDRTPGNGKDPEKIRQFIARARKAVN